MLTVYAIKSIQRNYIYVGLTGDLKDRLHRHNSGLEPTTKPYCPFQLIYTKDFETRVEARAHEKHLKGGSRKEFLKQIKK